ncbi:conserved hypothetical protein [Candidatus Magnetomoraceae bacterium gMMP-15]
MDTITITYRLILPNGSKEVFDLKLDTEHLTLQTNNIKSLPSWTKLDFHQCPNCPLKIKIHPHCPLAIHLVNIVTRFDSLLSYDKIHIDVITNERLISQDTTAQKGISSLMGLIMATSGCPHTAFFKPMARFHLPLASEEETIYRATSTYLLAQYFLKKSGKNVDFELEGLTKIYNNMQIVNISIAERLRAATETDSTVNAVILLDMYAKTLPLVIEESLEEIQYLFETFFMGSKKS